MADWDVIQELLDDMNIKANIIKFVDDDSLGLMFDDDEDAPILERLLKAWYRRHNPALYSHILQKPETSSFSKDLPFMEYATDGDYWGEEYYEDGVGLCSVCGDWYRSEDNLNYIEDYGECCDDCVINFENAQLAYLRDRMYHGDPQYVLSDDQLREAGWIYLCEYDRDIYYILCDLAELYSHDAEILWSDSNTESIWAYGLTQDQIDSLLADLSWVDELPANCTMSQLKTAFARAHNLEGN